MDYAIRRSRRARHVWLKLTVSGELVVVVPQRFDVRLIPGVVASNSEWIRRAAARVALCRSGEKEASIVPLPGHVHLPAIGGEWTVEYRETRSYRVSTAELPGRRLLVSGATADVEACREALLRWLRRTARAHLVLRLQETAAANGFSLRGVTVRSQRTRWASCSRNGSISLNLRLLFVDSALVRHVMLHELCHTIQMNHSGKFWTLLERYDPDCRMHRRMLRAQWKQIPGWLTAPVSTAE